MVHILQTVPPALLGLIGIDLCLLDGQYTYWILSAAVSLVPF